MKKFSLDSQCTSVLRGKFLLDCGLRNISMLLLFFCNLCHFVASPAHPRSAIPIHPSSVWTMLAASWVVCLFVNPEDYVLDNSSIDCQGLVDPT